MCKARTRFSRRPGFGAANRIFPPTGLGFQVNAAAAKGGGMLDFQTQPEERLSGSFEINVGVVRASALTVLQRVGDGFSLVTLLAGRFKPGIQLGFGFAISGVGGLVGINRHVNVDALRVQFTNGAIVDALAADPIGDAPAVLATLGSVFAPHVGSHVIGPTLQIAWLKVAQRSFFSVDVGVFLQLPAVRVDMIGSARAEVPPVFGWAGRARRDRPEVPLPPKIPSLAQALAPELNASNVRTEGGDDRWVAVSRRAASGETSHAGVPAGQAPLVTEACAARPAAPAFRGRAAGF